MPTSPGAFIVRVPNSVGETLGLLPGDARPGRGDDCGEYLSLAEWIIAMSAPAESITGTPFWIELERYAAADPDRPSLTCAGVTVSRAELLDRARRVAGRLADLGVRRGDTVTLSLPNSVEFGYALLAIWLLGATPQPISPKLPPIEREAIVELAKPVVAIGVPALSGGAVSGAGYVAMSVDDIRTAVDHQPPYCPDELVVSPVWKTMTSGGSSGRPKLIVSRTPAVIEPIQPLGLVSRMRPDGTVLLPGPMTHNGPFIVLIGALLLGNHLVVMPRFDAAETLRLIEEHRVSWVYLVPTMMQRIWRLPAEIRVAADLSSVETVMHMAAPCPRWLKQAWIDWLGADRIMDLYSGTEMQALTAITGQEWLSHPGSVGRVLLGEIDCRDETGKSLPPGVTGELWMRRGAGQPAPYQYIGATAKSADGGWESLGDIGYLDADGYVYLTDRDTDMILVGGTNVYPAEIEAAIDEHPAIATSCVIGLPDDDLGNAPYAIIQPIAPVTDEELLAHLRERVPSYHLPRAFERVTEPLRDDAGKVRRSQLRAARLNP